MKLVRRPRRLAMAAATIGIVLGASGCAYINPVQTHDFYQSGDGMNIGIQDERVGIRNAIVVIDDEGTATLLGAVVNQTSDPVTVEIEGSYQGTVVFSNSVDVEPGDAVELNAESTPVLQSTELEAPVGGIMDVTVTTDGETEVGTVPVTDTSLDFYEQAVQSDGGGQG